MAKKEKASAKKAARGRPRRYVGDRPNWTIRLEERYAAVVRAEAEKSSRSLSAVCEEMIMRAIDGERVLEVISKRHKELERELDATREKLYTERVASREELKNLLLARQRTTRFGLPRRDKKR